MKKLVITKGLPGSGKSTWASEFVKGKKDWVRVNNDSLQLMMFGVEFAEGRGDFLDKVRMHLVDFMVAQNMNIVIDNTNLHPKQELYYRTLVEERNFAVENKMIKGDMYEFSVKDFTDVPVAECVKRDSLRPKPVGPKVIYKMYDSYLKKEAPALTQDPSLPRAIVVDLDGTMALLHDRSPFDMTKVYNDLPNRPIVDLVFSMKQLGKKIFFISGRDESSHKETVRWLKDKAAFQPGTYELFLRPDKDPRPDTQYKKDIFEQHLKGKYYVDFWIEDRWRMTNAVRNELGIMCLQCADGHF